MEYPPETHAIPIPKMQDLPLVDGPFKGTAESLRQFQCPDWFRDGKFGIWAHWGPQAVTGDGDWYARQMYMDQKRYGHNAYQSHLKLYGHPSKAGYKDILPLWKAEKWDPDHLMELYKAAGAHYFVAQAVHHDNFDNWNSKYQKWNSVKIGPHKDMVGIWQTAAKKLDLPFGVSEHLGHSFTFMQSSHGSDKSGPFAGVPYDGANPPIGIYTSCPLSRATPDGIATIPVGRRNGMRASTTWSPPTSPTCFIVTADYPTVRRAGTSWPNSIT